MTLFAVPYNIHDGSGSPTRVFALPSSVFAGGYGDDDRDARSVAKEALMGAAPAGARASAVVAVVTAVLAAML